MRIRLTIAFTAFLVLSSLVDAQTPGYLTSSNETGFPEYGSFITSQIDSVNLSNGGVSIRIPIVSRKGRGLDYSYGYRYDSKGWVVDSYVLKDPWQRPIMRFKWRPMGFWNSTINLERWATGWTEQIYECQPIGLPNSQYNGTVLIKSNWVAVAPDGTQYQFPVIKSYPLYPSNPCTEYGVQQFTAHSSTGHTEIDITNDGGSHPSLWNVKFRAKDGSFPGGWATPYQTKDANGNWCCGIGSTWWTDTLGREVGADSFYDSDGQIRTVQVEWVSLILSTSFPTASPYPAECSFDQALTGTNVGAVKKITLPNGLSYEFFYETWWDAANPTAQNPYGEVTKIRLPTGGYIKYKFATIAQMDFGPDGASNINCSPMLDARVVVERRVSEDGTTENVWTYSYGYGGPGGVFRTTSVTDPQGNVEVHTFTDTKIRLETQVEYRQGASTPLRRVDTAWASDDGPIYARQYSPGQEGFGVFGIFELGPRNSRVIRRTTTLLDTNQISKTETDYDCFTYSIINTNFTDCRENPTQIREYDFGAGSPGPLLRYTTLTYLHNVNPAYLNAHIWDRVKERKVFDAGGNLKAQTRFSYDTTPITATSGVPQHDYVGYPSTYTIRGNRTLIENWRNTDGAWLATTNYFNDVGNLIQTTDPGGHTTTYSYADNFSDGVNRSSQGYVTQVTYPTTGGVSHTERKQYFWYTGLTAAQCGQNFPAGSACSNASSPPQPDYARFTYDLLGRPLTVTRGDGGQTTFTFAEPLTPSPAMPITVSSSTKIDATLNLVNTAVIDGLGRVKQTQLNSDPQGAVYVDTTYDALGRKATVTNPYRSAAESTFGVTAFEYDALGRVTKVIPPDGTPSANNVSTAYSGNAVTVTDQAGKQRRSFTDGLGRLVTVHEPGNGQTAPTAAAPGTGWVQVTGDEQSHQEQQWVEQCVLYDETGACLQWDGHWEYTTSWDTGGVSVTVNGLTKSATYGASSTAAALATALGSAINADATYSVTAAVNSTTITLTARISGAATNYTLAVSSWTNDPAHFPSPSFVPVRSGPTLTGGSDYSPGNPGSGLMLLSTPAVTTYTYDTLDNLTQVVQSGSRPRTFTYNSLAQLLSATNPESGAITYAYDADGNLQTKIAPAPNQTGSATVTTTFTYDALHRLTQKNYTDATPVVKYAYDGTSPVGCSPTLTVTNGVGRRTAMCDGAGWEAWSFDGGGQVAADRRNTNGVTKDFTYGYNLAGGVTSLAYPTGRTIAYAYNSAAQPTSAIDAANSINYAQNASYAPQGALASLQNGASIVSTFYYNNRLQPCRISVRTAGVSPASCGDATNIGNVLDFSYGFAASTANNGNVASIANNRNTNRSQSFTYDELNRIKTSQSAAASGADCWGLQFGYDIWANLLSASVTKCSAPMLSLTVNTSNRITNTSFSYDAAGDLLTDGTNTYTWDAESRMKTAAGVTYTYDGDGRRVKKSNGKLYWNNLAGDPLAESDLAGNISDEYIFFGGKRTARRIVSSGAVSYYFADHLGSSRVVTNSAGTILDDSDFYPFGGERVISSTSGNNYKFTGKERDTESSLDYFGARYYASSSGRYLSADWSASPSPVPYADFTNPQSLNLYAYVGNNPLNATDPDGHCCAYSASSISDFIDSGVNRAVEYVREKAVSSGNQTAAGAATFVAGSTGDVIKGFTNLLRTGESVGSLPENASTGQVVNALAEEGGRVGGTILAVVAIAGPRTPATSEQGAQVAGEIGKNRVALDNGSVVDLQGKAHAGVQTPHIKDPTFNTNPQTGQVFQNKFGPVRPATVGDVNAAATAAGAKPPVTIPKPLPVPKEEKEKENQ